MKILSHQVTKYSAIILSFFIFSPTSASAAFFGNISCVPGRTPLNFRDLVFNLVIGCILSPAVYLIIGISVVVFLWGVLKFIRAEGDDKNEGRQFIVWGLVGLFIIVSLWALVSILQGTFNLNSTDINIHYGTPPAL